MPNKEKGARQDAPSSHSDNNIIRQTAEEIPADDKLFFEKWKVGQGVFQDVCKKYNVFNQELRGTLRDIAELETLRLVREKPIVANSYIRTRISGELINYLNRKKGKEIMTVQYDDEQHSELQTVQPLILTIEDLVLRYRVLSRLSRHLSENNAIIFCLWCFDDQTERQIAIDFCLSERQIRRIIKSAKEVIIRTKMLNSLGITC